MTPALTVKLAAVVPAPIVTEEGAAKSELSLESTIFASEDGGDDRVTEQIAVPPVAKLRGEQTSDITTPGANKDSTVCCVLLL